MSEYKNIAAFTAGGSNPPYVSINDKGNTVSLTVRGFSALSPDAKGTAEIQLTKETLIKLAKDVLTHYGERHE